eukprot:m.7661 g.7661  ORF g.7661 m.7661 type:complete len:54 (+) comp5302_c0_seq1:405-566(+)
MSQGQKLGATQRRADTVHQSTEATTETNRRPRPEQTKRHSRDTHIDSISHILT